MLFFSVIVKSQQKPLTCQVLSPPTLSMSITACHNPNLFAAQGILVGKDEECGMT